MGTLSPNAKQQFFTNNGTLASGYKLYTYESGTTTPLATYTDKAQTTANANPIILDSRGEAVIYLQSENYRFTLKDASDVTIWTRDNVMSPILDAAIGGVTPLICETVDAMKALTGLSDGAEINTLYHTSATGGGAGRYRYTTAGTPAADGVKVHAQDIGGGRFILLDSAITFNHAGAIGDDVADDSVAINAALALGIVLMGEPGKNKYFIGDELTAAQRTTIIGYGSYFRSSSHIKILTLTSYCEVFGLSISGPNATYTAAGYGIFASGTRNGATVAPTMLTDIKVIGTTINNIGNAGVEFDFVKNSVVITNRITNCGYAGGLFYSCDKVRALDNYVDTLSGETTSGQLNAYGFTFTSLSNTSDFVRDPVSVDCEASGNDIRNIPTWHALDTHGGKRIKFKKNNIYNCRRGVILTNLVTVGAEDCVVSGNNLCNELSGTNSNGSQKQGEAFWDVGQSATVRNKRNKIMNNNVYQHGDPIASVGAVYIDNTEDGAYCSNEFTQPYNYGAVIKNNVRRASISANTIVDPKGPGSGGGATNFPSHLLFDGTNMDGLTVSNNNLLRKNSSAAVKVGEIGINIANTALKTIAFKGNTFDGVVADWSAPDQTGISGDAELTYTGTLTGCTTSPTGLVEYTRIGNMVSLRIPTISGVSNTTAATITGGPANMRPAAQQICYIRVTDNGVTQDGMALIGIDGTITLWVGAGLNAFTNAGTKGVADTTISYKVK